MRMWGRTIKKILGYGRISLLFCSLGFAAPVRFDVSVNPNPFKTSEFADVTIKAIDSDGQVDTSYDEGDIWIEVEGFDYSDPDVVVPGGGIGLFEPADQGIKIFSKGLTIKTPGTYTLVVADVYDPSLKGTVEIEVLADNGGPEISDITVVNPIDGAVEKSDTVDIIGTTSFPNTPLEIFIDGISLQEGISDQNGDFNMFLSGLEPGEHVLKVNALDLEDAVVATSGPIAFTYEPAGGELFLGLDIDPGRSVMVNQKLTFTIRTADRVTSAFIRLWNGEMLPAERVKAGEFRKQLSIPDPGEYPVDVKLSVSGNDELFEGIDTVTVADENRRILTLDYTSDEERKKADLVWTYEGNIDYFKIKYGTNSENLRLSLTTASPKGTLILADASVPYFAQVYPVDQNGVVNGTPSDIITIAPAAPKDPVCGDGQREGIEECDDGNTVNGDGCNGFCVIETLPVCGNAKREGAEQCDDGNRQNGDGCNGFCMIELAPPTPVCGDGKREGLEQCDDGNLFNGDGCDALCRIQATSTCGDGIRELAEQCDDGNLTNGDGCNAVCVIEPKICGNGTLEAPEQCDDGNVIPGDGCDSSCMIEAPKIPSCYPEGIQIRTKKVGTQYYLYWEAVPQAMEYIIYRADQAVSSTKQMTVVGRSQQTTFEYPFDPYSEVDKWARYAVEAVCPDNAQKQVGDMTAVKVGPEKTILMMFLLFVIGFMGWRLVKT